jgi:hypothetical protein
MNRALQAQKFGPLIPGPAVVAVDANAVAGTVDLTLNQAVYVDGDLESIKDLFYAAGVAAPNAVSLIGANLLHLAWGGSPPSAQPLAIVGPLMCLRSRTTGQPVAGAVVDVP